MARLIIKKYKNNNDKSAAYGKTYGRLVHQDTMNTSDLCRSLLSHSYQAYMFILTQRRRGRRVHAENFISHRKHGNHRKAMRHVFLCANHHENQIWLRLPPPRST